MFATDILNIEDGSFIDGYSEQYSSFAEGYDIMPKLAAKLSSLPAAAAAPAASSNAAQQGGKAAAAPPPPAANKTYKVGDTGPAGGIVFYDKGVYADGWRYLEAAPHDFTMVEWGTFNNDVKGTDDGIGSGKKNTQIILEALKSAGETGKAAQLCAAFEMDGYNGWFLPSNQELELALKVLITKEDQTLVSERGYWSSTQVNKAMVLGVATVKGKKGWSLTRLTPLFFERTLISGNIGKNKNTALSVRAVRGF
jgi:hypothetical protein